MNLLPMATSVGIPLHLVSWLHLKNLQPWQQQLHSDFLEFRQEFTVFKQDVITFMNDMNIRVSKVCVDLPFRL
jgi:hypothetical protein